MRPLKVIGIIAAVLIAGVGVFFGTQYIADNYLDTHAEEHRSEVPCRQQGKAYHVVIKDNTATPSHTVAKLCDTLRVTNEDERVRNLAFGSHDHHQPYDGKTENTIKKGQSVTVVLNKAGDYMFHDHLQDATKGTFSVVD